MVKETLRFGYKTITESMGLNMPEQVSLLKEFDNGLNDKEGFR